MENDNPNITSISDLYHTITINTLQLRLIRDGLDTNT